MWELYVEVVEFVVSILAMVAIWIVIIGSLRGVFLSSGVTAFVYGVIAVVAILVLPFGIRVMYDATMRFLGFK